MTDDDIARLEMAADDAHERWQTIQEQADDLWKVFLCALEAMEENLLAKER